MTAATNARRLRPDLEIVRLREGPATSYCACGIPYLVAGDVDDVDALVGPHPAGAARRHRIDVRVGHEVMGIDLDAPSGARCTTTTTTATFRIGFDQLLIGTGARPIAARPARHRRRPGPRRADARRRGADLLALPRRAAAERGGRRRRLHRARDGRGVRHAGGPRSRSSTRRPASCGTLDPDMARWSRPRSIATGSRCAPGCEVKGFEPGTVHTDAGPLAADLVVLGPRRAAQRRAGRGGRHRARRRGAIKVDRRQQPASRACGRPATAPSRSTWSASGRCTSRSAPSPTARAGWPASTSAAATPPSRVWSAPPSPRCAPSRSARTGLDRGRGRPRPASAPSPPRIESTTRAGYFPGAAPITVKLVAERRHRPAARRPDRRRRGLGQAHRHAGHRHHRRHDRRELVDLDLSYAPPFSPVWDPVAIAARKLLKLL